MQWGGKGYQHSVQNEIGCDSETLMLKKTSRNNMWKEFEKRIMKKTNTHTPQDEWKGKQIKSDPQLVCNIATLLSMSTASISLAAGGVTGTKMLTAHQE